MAEIIVQLDADRTKYGLISLVDKSGITIVSLSALGKASNTTAKNKGNPYASTLLPYGDTPLGEYEITKIENTSNYSGNKLKSYGNKGKIWLDPISGDALLAKNVGRTELRIHGKGKDNEYGKLIVTNGCIRMLNSEIEELINKINDLVTKYGDQTTICRVEEITSDNQMYSDPNIEIEEGDPPA